CALIREEDSIGAPRVVESMALLADTVDCSILLVDSKGRVLSVSGELPAPVAETLPSEVLALVARPGGFRGQLQGLFPAIEEAAAMTVSVSRGDITVLATGGRAAVEGMMQSLMSLFTTAAYGILALALTAIYFSIHRMARPLKSMSYAARRFGQGNFDVRVQVNGDDEMAELAMAFNNMADSLDKTEQMRSSFIANVSHDLKTPMTTISGFVDGILDGTIPQELQSHYLQLVSDETRRLSRLVNTLMDLAKFESDEVELKIGPFDLCETVRQVLISFEHSIGDKRLSLDLSLSDEAITARGDPDAIHRVLYNIIDNAIKFTPPEGMLTVTVEKKERQALCSVCNSGDGVPEEDLPHLFSRFYKSDKSRSLDRRGSGLGLYIAKTIIDRHGGTIYAESEQGKSCTLSFSLPLHQSRPTLQGLVEQKGKGSRRGEGEAKEEEIG
ncbi:MAG: HAMP domain-containing histidine kinase, partial [Clostridia bacterium]|nr:HAMP domain-containing histidine kinase [Clostridia bacterium]